MREDGTRNVLESSIVPEVRRTTDQNLCHTYSLEIVSIIKVLGLGSV